MIVLHRISAARVSKIAGFMLAAAALSCCAPDRVVFVTSTNVGVGYDGATATGHVGYDRQELYVAPDYPKTGTLPPVAASLQSSLDWFAPSVTQYYATGDAALIATGKITVPSAIDRSTIPDDPAHAAERCALNMGCDWKDKDDRRLSVVGTSTHVGLVVKTKDAEMTSVDFGYGRQEASMLPLLKEKGKDIYPSAYASITVNTDKDSNDVAKGLAINQFFATGAAADALADTTAAKTSFGVIAGASAQSQTNSLQKSLSLSDPQVASLDAKAAAAANSVNSDATALVTALLGRDASTNSPIAAADRAKLVVAANKIANDDIDKQNALIIVNDPAVSDTDALRNKLASHPNVLYALYRAN